VKLDARPIAAGAPNDDQQSHNIQQQEQEQADAMNHSQSRDMDDDDHSYELSDLEETRSDEQHKRDPNGRGTDRHPDSSSSLHFSDALDSSQLGSEGGHSIDERELRRQLNDVESSFLPESIPAHSTGRTGRIGADDTYVNMGSTDRPPSLRALMGMPLRSASSQRYAEAYEQEQPMSRKIGNSRRMSTMLAMQEDRREGENMEKKTGTRKSESSRIKTSVRIYHQSKSILRRLLLPLHTATSIGPYHRPARALVLRIVSKTLFPHDRAVDHSNPEHHSHCNDPNPRNLHEERNHPYPRT